MADEKSKEIDKFMDSLDKALLASSDDVIYDKYEGALPQKNAAKSEKPPEASYYISLSEREGIEALKGKYASLPATPNKRCTIVRKFHLSALILAIAIFLPAAYSIWYRRTEKASKIAEVKETPPGPRTGKIDEDRHDTIPEPEQRDNIRPAPGADAGASLNELLSGRYRPEEIASAIILLTNSNTLTPRDIPLLSQLYEKYASHPAICRAIIANIGGMEGKEARAFLERLSLLPESDKTAIVEALWKFQDREGKRSILQILQRETSPRTCIDLIVFLSDKARSDNEVNKNFIAKFYAAPEEEVRSYILSAMAVMKIPQQNFFLQVISNREYGTSLRIKAVEALMNNCHLMQGSMENTNDLLFELSRLSISTDDFLLKERLQYAIKVLSE